MVKQSLKIVLYRRVSTRKQGASGLGVEGQQIEIDRYVATSGAVVVGTYVETESGRKSNRPQLQRALAHCRMANAILVVAKLDRLSRNVAFLSALMESGTDFIALDNPTASKLVLHVMVAFAQHEAEQASIRTKAALAAAKARGVLLGSHRPGHWDGKEEARQEWLVKARDVSLKTRQKKAMERAEFMLPVIRNCREQGMSLPQIANGLNASGYTTARGCQWTPMAVKRILDLVA